MSTPSSTPSSTTVDVAPEMTPVRLVSIRCRTRAAADRISRGTLTPTSVIADREALLRHIDDVTTDLAQLRADHTDLQDAMADVVPILRAAVAWAADPVDEAAAGQLLDEIHAARERVTAALPAGDVQ